MADLVTSILAGAATVTVMALREAISWGVSRGRAAQVPPPSTTMLPPPPQPSQPSLPHIGGDCYARADGERLERTVGEQAKEIRKASDTLIEIKTILELRAKRRGENGNGTRESGGG